MNETIEPPALSPVELLAESGMSKFQVGIIGGGSERTISNLDRPGHTLRASTLARFYAAVGRMDLADTLRPGISDKGWSEVLKVRDNHAVLAAGFRNVTAERRRGA